MNPIEPIEPVEPIAPSDVDGSGRMFDGIAERYDLLNRVMSLGMDRGWRRRLVDSLGVEGTHHVLDLATGTADVAIAIATEHPQARVTGIDPSEGMLSVGREKVLRLGLADRVELSSGDAQNLPLADNTFDSACISFGIRNVPDRRKGLMEMVRVTRPSGVVSILELGEPRRGPMAGLARFHVHQVVPRLGALLSGSAEYDYLQRSIASFPPPEEFSGMMGAVGLSDVTVQPLGFGAAHLYRGIVAPR